MENITSITTNLNRSVSQIDTKQTSSIVTACSGLGVKSEFYLERKMYKELAQDIVASTFNKLACSGAEVVGFSQYLLSKDKTTTDIIELEIGSELKKYNCKQMSVRTEFSDSNSAFCGLALGIDPVEKQEIVSGDIVIGLKSSGLHVNGFSKIKELYKTNQLTEDELLECLKVSYNYYPEIFDLYKNGKIKLGINISKGGILYCLNKVLPKGLNADLNLKHISIEPIFEKLKDITGDEFYNIFNGGIGFCMIAERASDEIFFQECQKYQPIVLGVIQ